MLLSPLRYINPFNCNRGGSSVTETFNALKFDGEQTSNAGLREYVDLPTISLSGEFSIFFKIKAFRPFNSANNMFLTNNAATNYLYLRNTSIRFNIGGTNSQFSSLLVNVFDGSEHTVLITRDSSNLVSLYLDGAFIETKVAANASTATITSIQRYASGNLPMNGVLVNTLAISDGYCADSTDATNLQTELPENVLSSLIRNYDFTTTDKDSLVLVDKVNTSNNGTLTQFRNVPEFWRDFTNPFPTITVTNNINIALAGQSNGTGRFDASTRASGLALQYLNSACYQYGIKSKMRFGNSGINNYNDWDGDYGVEYRVTDSLQGTNNVTWLKHTRGGSSVGVNTGGTWASTGDDTLAIISEASTNSYTPDWLIWIQGESDAANATDAAAYQTNLEATFSAFRTAWGAGLKIIIVKLYDFPSVGDYASDVQTAQEAIATAQGNTYLVDPVTEGIDSMTDLLDTIHYNALGNDKIASACYDIIAAN